MQVVCNYIRNFYNFSLKEPFTLPPVLQFLCVIAPFTVVDAAIVDDFP